MNPKLKRFLMYTTLPIVYIALGYVLLFVAGSDFVDMIRAQVSVAMTKGAPDYPNGFDKSLYQKALEEGSVESWSEVPLPALGTAYGVITCDNLNIEADVYYGDDEKSLMAGVGQYSGSNLFGCGGTILLGAHDTTYFAGLENVQIGDVFEVQTNYGHYTYRVNSTKVVKADDSSAYNLDEQHENLILYTCYPFGDMTTNRKKRFFVYCDRIDDGPTIKIQIDEETLEDTSAGEVTSQEVEDNE